MQKRGIFEFFDAHFGRLGKHNRAYFEQALIDKEVFVFYTYPIEEET